MLLLKKLRQYGPDLRPSRARMKNGEVNWTSAFRRTVPGDANRFPTKRRARFPLTVEDLSLPIPLRLSWTRDRRSLPRRRMILLSRLRSGASAILPNLPTRDC